MSMFRKKYLKPRFEQEKPTDKMVNASPSKMLEHHMASEHFDAHKEKNPRKFRSSLEALVLNMFDHGDDDAKP